MDKIVITFKDKSTREVEVKKESLDMTYEFYKFDSMDILSIDKVGDN